MFCTFTRISPCVKRWKNGRTSALPPSLCGLDLEASEDVPISSFPRRRDYKAVTVTTDMPSLLQAAIDQNFVPVVDDRNVFIGMVRRTVILRDVYNKYGAKLDKPRQNTYTHA